MAQWLNTLGVALNVVGTILIARSLLVSVKAARNSGRTVLRTMNADGQLQESPEMKLRASATKAAWAGVLFVLLGAALQIWATWSA